MGSMMGSMIMMGSMMGSMIMMGCTPEEIPSFLQYQKDIKDAFSLKKLSDTFGKEQVYGANATFGGEPVDMTNYKPSNRFGSGSQQRPVLYPRKKSIRTSIRRHSKPN